MTDLSWESSYAIARELHSRHPEIDFDQVSIEDIFRWTVSLPEFSDDPDLVNDEILYAIYQDWYEEANPL
ncbi:MAG: Fe-S cluster assembly protein IscX [Anaerolineales bacterium]|nr:Fe-S cluster assembly protein IscX [Anaerolineales bacterium]